MKELLPVSLQVIWFCLICLEIWLAVTCWRVRSERWPLFRLYATTLAARSVGLGYLTYFSSELSYIYLYWYGLLAICLLKFFVTVEVYRNIFYPSSTLPVRIRRAISTSMLICVAAVASFSLMFPGSSLDALTLLARNLDRATTFLTLLAFLVIYNCSRWLLLSQGSQALRVAAGFIFYHAVALCITHVEISASASSINILSHMRTATFAVAVGIWITAIRRREVYPDYSEADLARLKTSLENRVDTLANPQEHASATWA